MKDEQFVVWVSLHVKPEHVDTLLTSVHRILDAMRVEDTFVNTVLLRDVNDPYRFNLYETWIDLEDFQKVQMKREYRLEYEAILPSLLQSPREMKIYDILRGDFVFQNGPAQTILK